MINFACPHCSQRVFFHNLSCSNCSTDIAYDTNLDAFTDIVLAPCASRSGAERCNWLATTPNGLCASCVLDTDHFATELRWSFQQAKRRTLRQLRLFGIDPSMRHPNLRFELAEGSPANPVTTGHADGLITLDTAEADRLHREEVRQSMGEPYRTPLGHVRHELGHWWWATAINFEFSTDSFRGLFGDESADYQAALEAHYGQPDDGSWTTRFVSHYASAHPWEDFAESFAHFLHMMDTSETAFANSFVTTPMSAGFDQVYRQWVPLTTALNELNHSMGTPDPYPFAVPGPAIDKIRFVAASLGRC